MLKINNLSIKNFMSIGAIAQTITFSSSDLVLVLGENLDLGGNDNRNGVGKSAIVNALSYALYGTALTNIKKDNLINVTNSKGMTVTLNFEVNGINYTITRGRKPNIFKFIKDGIEEESDDDESQGENRHTQAEIERIIGISHTMFKHVLALNTYVEPFLSMRVSDQRDIIEQLLGITKLSEKAEKLKELSKITKDDIKEEEFRISAASEANKRIETNITGLVSKSKAWNNSKASKIAKLQESITTMLDVDIDVEIAAHNSKKDIDELNTEYRALTRELKGLEKEVTESEVSISRLDRILRRSEEKICPTCNQDMDKGTHDKVHNEYMTQHTAAIARLSEKQSKYSEIKTLTDSVAGVIPSVPVTFYNTVDEAYNHKSTLDTLGNSLSSEMMLDNPYDDQIESLREHGLQDINFAKLNDLTTTKVHQDFLIKLLTSKDSFIRKHIIDQNLSFLNHRLSHYLVNIGLPHVVKFKSDLEVEISMYGKEFDFDNLSRGERTRLILSLSWAFRDVFESINDKISLLFIDELVDQGIDTAGTDAVLKILKDMSRDSNRNIFLISHKEDFIPRISNILRVIKENGYTSILENTEIIE